MVPRGVRVSEGMVRQLMQDMGLVSIRESSKEYYDKEKCLHKNYLNQQFHTTRPNEVWVSDITCFRYNEKKLFICVIIDLFARKVISFKISDSLNVTYSLVFLLNSFNSGFSFSNCSKTFFFYKKVIGFK